ncbi:MAG TPA: hypothetical protein VML50_05765 [Anaeromyxobacter sp.]|nr:hypothetical protein [Anaeromyxobacter sp.]
MLPHAVTALAWLALSAIALAWLGAARLRRRRRRAGDLALLPLPAGHKHLAGVVGGQGALGLELPAGRRTRRLGTLLGFR